MSPFAFFGKTVRFPGVSSPKSGSSPTVLAEGPLRLENRNVFGTNDSMNSPLFYIDLASEVYL